MAASRDDATMSQVSETRREYSSTPGFDLLGSQYQGVLKSAVERPSKPTPLDLPSRTRQLGPADPEDPLTAKWQRTLWSAFACFGRVGLANELHLKAAQEDHNACTKGQMPLDEDREYFTSYHLHTSSKLNLESPHYIRQALNACNSKS
ncbi:MAG: hypothetical protein LQ338_007220 [Usnochroma carphineum]|nr:MAG: hypothetical protein LQ338_007220 [Usnochroma carphineum]